MKTIADIKRAMQVGVKVHCFNHRLGKDMGVRTVSIVQTNSFALVTEVNGVLTDSWCNFPKRDEVEYSDNSFTVLLDYARQGEAPDFKKVLTYTFV